MCTIIYCTKTLKERWLHRHLADEWRKSYPNLFDEDDFRLAKSQPMYHFIEWFAAIHIFHRDGVHSLVTKCHCSNHKRKLGVLSKLPRRDIRDYLLELREEENVATPDLLLYRPDFSDFWFAEVKGPGDRLASKQKESHKQIKKHFNDVKVEIVKVRPR